MWISPTSPRPPRPRFLDTPNRPPEAPLAPRPAAPATARLTPDQAPATAWDQQRNLAVEGDFGALPWEAEKPSRHERRVERRRDDDRDRKKPGEVHRSVSYQAPEGPPKQVDQLFETSCAAVEAMAAWDREPGNTFEAERKRLAETGRCTLPNGEGLTLREETRAEIDGVLPPGMPEDQTRSAYMQAALMQKADPAWGLGSPEGLDAAGVARLAEAVGTGLFLPGAGEAAFEAQLQAHGAVQVVIGEAEAQHAVTARAIGEGRFGLYEGNAPVLGPDGLPLEPTWGELEEAMADRTENVGAGRMRVAAAFTTGTL